MSERRSSRSHNAVKYSGFDDESDDDFAAVSSHPPKKPKSSKRDEATKKTKKFARDKEWSLDVDIVDSSLIKSCDSSKTRRAPLSEKIYERELQEALELSILETGGSQDVLIQDSNKPQPEAPTSALYVDDNIHQQDMPGTASHPQPQESPENCATKAAPNLRQIPGTVVVDDSIHLLQEENGESIVNKHCRQKRASGRQAGKRPRLVDSDDENSAESDYKPEADSDGGENSRSDIVAEISDESDTNSDFGYSPKKRKQTKPKLNKTVANARDAKPLNRGIKKTPKIQQVKIKNFESSDKTTVSSPASKVNTTKPSTSMNISSETSIKSTSDSSAASNHSCQKLPISLVSQWKPPSRAGPNQTSTTMLRSPSSGLRLGLSRNQRVKPLHPSVNVA